MREEIGPGQRKSTKKLYEGVFVTELEARARDSNSLSARPDLANVIREKSSLFYLYYRTSGAPHIVPLATT